MIDSDNEERRIKPRSPYHSNTRESSASGTENTGISESTESYTIETPISPPQADDTLKLKEQDGLSESEKAAMERSMKKHRRAYDRLASE